MHPIAEIAQDLLAESVLFQKEEFPFEGTLTPGHSKVLLVTGENAAGKSFLFQALHGWARAHYDLVGITVSIRERTGAGTREDGGMRRMMMFGDEAVQSTGACSVSVIERAFGNISEPNHFLMLDEPELGLSDGYAIALGRYLAQKASEMPEASAGLVVVTHHRGLARALADELGQTPSFVFMRPKGSQESLDFSAWLSHVESRSVEDLLKLRTLGFERKKAVREALEESKKPERAAPGAR